MHDSTTGRRLRVGSLFSGYGGLDLAVEYQFIAETIWFSEINEPVARVFSHHWPDVPNLGDITAIDWTTVPSVDIVCGGFPCQDVSTVGKQAGLAPGTRSGLWANMAAAIEVLQPEWVVIENVRGLLSAPATRPPTQGAPDGERNPFTATLGATTLCEVESDPWGLGDESARSLRALGSVLGDLADLGFNAEWVGLPASLIGAPHHRFRIFILAHRQTLPNPAGFGLLSRQRDLGSGESQTRNDCTLTPDHRLRTPRTGWLTDQTSRIGHVVDTGRADIRQWGKYAPAITRWKHVTGHDAPAPALLDEFDKPRPAPEFVEWLMGLPRGWVTDVGHKLTANEQLMTLGNGVLLLQATTAIAVVRSCTGLGD
ncbi:MAG: DNA cytosine methyltransferase [Yaniella sp.]|nr:DNA cytosine methyltransferase [Yaniella sp.]MDN6148407.1 DNA cytosine methyltransferase [Yaniella sp.]